MNTQRTNLDFSLRSLTSVAALIALLFDFDLWLLVDFHNHEMNHVILEDGDIT